MKLLEIYEGKLKFMSNTPVKIAVFTDGKNIKVFQKAFFINNLNRPNWCRNVILEKYNTIKALTNKIIALGCTVQKKEV